MHLPSKLNIKKSSIFNIFLQPRTKHLTGSRQRWMAQLWDLTLGLLAAMEQCVTAMIMITVMIKITLATLLIIMISTISGHY